MWGNSSFKFVILEFYFYPIVSLSIMILIWIWIWLYLIAGFMALKMCAFVHLHIEFNCAHKKLAFNLMHYYPTVHKVESNLSITFYGTRGRTLLWNYKLFWICKKFSLEFWKCKLQKNMRIIQELHVVSTAYVLD